MKQAPQHPIVVTAPARLHFGLLSFGQPGARQFGGVGAMVSPPTLRLTFQAANTFQAAGPLAERVAAFAETLFHSLTAGGHAALAADMQRCRIEVEQPLTSHVGLGSGTQLALSVAAGLHAFCGMPIPPAGCLSKLVGRAGRSAIGTYGFEQGGMLLEGGKLAREENSPLVARSALPEWWRFVLLRPATTLGLSGQQEQGAFDRLPPVPPETTDRLCRVATEQLFPAAEQHQFATFSAALYEYGLLAGSCFAEAQGGAFNGPVVTQLIERIRSLGIVGVGQSSWGPTVFALTEDNNQAVALAARLEAASNLPISITIAAPANHGAQIVNAT